MCFTRQLYSLRWLIDTRGTVSAGSLSISLLLVVLAFGAIYYFLFSCNVKQLAAHGDEITQNNKSAAPIRYLIKDILPQSPSPADNDKTRLDAMTPSDQAADNLSGLLFNKNELDSKGGPHNGWLMSLSIHDLEDHMLIGDDDALISKDGPTAHPSRLYVRVPVGRVRVMASETATVATRLFRGEEIKLLAEDGDWLRISTEDGREGWAHRNLFSKTAPPDIVKDNLTYINDVRIENLTEKGGDVLIELDAYGLPRTMMLKGEHPRLVFDFYGFAPKLNLAKHINIDKGPIRAIRLGYHSGEQSKTRVVIDLLPDYKYIVDKEFIVEINTYCIHIRL